MKKMILLLFALFFLTVFSTSVNAQWWNSSWHYRLPVNISSSSQVTNASVNVTVNFTALLEQVGDISYIFDPNSIRVVESDELPYDFINTTRDTGNVSFIVNGTTAANTNRTFYIYFDSMENGAKSKGKIITENVSWKSGYNNSMNLWSNQSTSPGIGYEWNRSWAQSLEVSWKWCTEAGFDSAYLYINGAQVRQKDGTGGSENILFQGNRLASRFYSDESYKPPSCSDYGSYVEWVKFYPTANYTTPALNVTKGTVSTQYSPVLGNASVSPSSSSWGNFFNYSIDIYDRETDSVNVTLWILENSGWVKNETKTINPPGNLYWYISPFSCSDIGLRNYKFEYRDEYHSWNNTTETTGPTLDKDNTILEYWIGNGSSVNREGDTNITTGIRFKDIVKNQYVLGESINFWVFYAGIWNNIGSNTTTADGNTSINFNPNCSVERGSHYWKANYSGTCYKNNESTLFNFTVIGQLKNYLTKPTAGSSYYRNDMIPLEANITDECTNFLTGANVNFTLNESYTCLASDNGNGSYNCTWNSTSMPLGNYSIRVNSSIANYSSNSTLWSNRFGLEAAPPSISINISKSQIEQLGSLQINATVTDIAGVGIQWVKINVTKPDGSVDQNNMTNITSTIWTISYPDSWGNTSQKGTYNISVYAMDNNLKRGSSNTSFKVYTRLNITLVTFQPQYYQGSYGSIYCRVNDLVENLTGVDINLTVRDSNGNGIYLLSGKSYETDSTGKIAAVFVIPSDAPVGNYTVLANVSFNDTTANLLITNSTTYNFEVLKEELLSVKLIVPAVQYVNQHLSLSLLAYRYQTQMIDPDQVEIAIYYSTTQFGLVKWFNISKDNMTRKSEGFYTYSRLIGSEVTSGNYIAVLNATKGNTQVADVTAFEILVGGPFDVSVNALKAEVAPGEELPFEINVTNKGATDRFDVNVSYWIGNGSRYFERTAINVPAYSSVKLEKSFTIYSDEPQGIYSLSASVVYDPTFPAATASTTFQVKTTAVPPVAPVTTGAAGGAVVAVAAPPLSKLNISSYPEEVEIERGWLGYANIVINNTGATTLYNLSIDTKGILLDWVEISPEKIELLVPTNTAKFVIKIAVPINAESGNYPVTIKAMSNDISDEKTFILRVFASEVELIQYQIQTLEEQLEDLEGKTADAENQGRNVTVIKSLLEEARKRIGDAENYVNNKMYDEASILVRNIKDLLSKAKYELEVAPSVKPTPTILQTLKRWFYLIVAFLVAIFVLIVYLIRRTKHFVKFKESIPTLRRAVFGKHISAELQKEKDKLEKMLNLIEAEYRKGIISKESYEELKNRNVEKLNEINVKLGEEK